MVGEPVVLLVTNAALLPGSAVVWALSSFEDKVAFGKNLAVSTNASQFGGKLNHASSSVEVVISLGFSPGFHSIDWVKELARVIRPGGVLVLQEHGMEDKVALERSLLLAGFVGIETMEAVEGLSIANGLSGFTLRESILLRAQKPTWEAGSSFPIKRKTVAAQDSAPTSNGSSVTSWKLPTVEVDDDFDLVDEDSLLTEEDLKRPELPADDDCEVGKAGRKACKNCTCGRAELEEKGKLSTELLNNPKSQCGNCGLGDAFRCGSCPYRGLPPFKLGEKITLPGTLLTADV